MSTRRYLLVIVASVAGAVVCMAFAAVLDAPLLAVFGVGFVVAAVAARWALLDDVVMAGLIVAFFVAAVIVGVVNTI